MLDFILVTRGRRCQANENLLHLTDTIFFLHFLSLSASVLFCFFLARNPTVSLQTTVSVCFFSLYLSLNLDLLLSLLSSLLPLFISSSIFLCLSNSPLSIFSSSRLSLCLLNLSYIYLVSISRLSMSSLGLSSFYLFHFLRLFISPEFSRWCLPLCSYP